MITAGLRKTKRSRQFIIYLYFINNIIVSINFSEYFGKHPNIIYEYIRLNEPYYNKYERILKLFTHIFIHYIRINNATYDKM